MTESIFENRFKYVDELIKMGANITVESNTAIVTGVEQYHGAVIDAPDLRAGAALVTAALAAKGLSQVFNIHFIERGYEDFPEKLRSLGGEIVKVDTREEEENAKRTFLRRAQ